MKHIKITLLLLLVLILGGCENYGGGTENTAAVKKILWEKEESINSKQTIHKYIEEISSEEFRAILNEKNPTKYGDKSFLFGTELLSKSEEKTYKKFVETLGYADYGEVSLNIVYGDPTNKWYVYWIEYTDGSDGTGVLEPFVKFEFDINEGLPEDAMYVRYGYTVRLDKVDDEVKGELEKLGLEQDKTPGFEYIFSGNFSMTILMEDLYYKDLTK